MSYVYEAAQEIAQAMDGRTVVVTKSTVPVGTGDEIEAIFKRVRPDADVAIGTSARSRRRRPRVRARRRRRRRATFPRRRRR